MTGRVARLGDARTRPARQSVVGEAIERLAAQGGGAARICALAFDAAEDVELAAPVEVFEVRQEAARLELGQAREPTLDPLGEFARRLAGEGQAEDLVATDEPVGDEPDDPARHRLGLAAACAGDDERGRERRRDDGGLLGRRGKLPEGRGDRLR